MNEPPQRATKIRKCPFSRGNPERSNERRSEIPCNEILVQAILRVKRPWVAQALGRSGRRGLHLGTLRLGRTRHCGATTASRRRGGLDCIAPRG